jgi:hypothetical protein
LFPAIFPVVAGVDGVSTEGMIEKRREEGGSEGLKKSKTVDKRFEIFALAQKESESHYWTGFLSGWCASSGLDWASGWWDAVRVEKACGYLSLDSISIMIMRNEKVAIRFSIKGSQIYSMNFFEIFFCLCAAQKDKKQQNTILSSKGGKKEEW